MSAGLIEKSIDGHLYEFEKWGADKSLTVLLDLASITGKPLGMAFGSLASGGPGKILDKEPDPNLISDILEALTVKLKKKAVMRLIKKMSSESMLCDGKRIDFNSHYADRLDHLFRVVYAALEVQYGNFFAGILGTVGIKAKASKLMNRDLRT